MTIKQFIDSYVPGIDSGEFVHICNSVGINNITVGYDETDTLNSEHVQRLLMHHKIKSRIINKTIIDNHNHLVGEYDALLEYYKNLLAQDPAHPENDKVLPQDRDGIVEIRNRVQRERDAYAAFVTGLKDRSAALDDNSLYLRSHGERGQVIDNAIAQNVVSGQQRKIENKDRKLSTKYARLEVLESKLERARTTFKKRRYNKKIDKLRRKIYKLQKKKGNISRRQRKVIDRNARRLERRYENNIDVSYKEAQREGNFAKNRVEYDNQKNDTVEDLERTARELEDLKIERLNGESVGSDIFSTRIDKMVLKSKLKTLARKSGHCNLGNQICRSWHDSFYRESVVR